MAELILTEEEKAAPSYLDWSDESLGRAVKQLATKFNDEYGKDDMYGTMAGFVLITVAKKTNATTLTLTLEGLTSHEVPDGDWKITVKQTKPPKESP